MKKYIVLIAVILLSAVGLLSLLGSSYFPMHDDTQVGRVIGMARSLSDGQFPVRWVSDLGYGFGYPLFNFYGPLPYYIGGMVHNLGFSALTATKIVMGIGMILAPVLAFLVLEPLLGIMSAAVSATVFMYAPYHAVQLYVRGAVGELYATAFLPLLFYGVVAPLCGKRNHRTVAIGGLGLALIILSHTIMGYVAVVLYGAWVVAYAFVSLVQKRPILSVLISYGLQVAIGLCLSAFFWLPAIFEMGYTNVSGQIGGTADFRTHFVCARQLLYSSWGFGGSTAGCIDGMSFKLGMAHIVLAIYAIFIMWVHRFRGKQRARVFAGGLVMTCVSLFLMLPISAFIWDYVPNFSYIQYPWRFLSIASFGIAVVIGASFSNSASYMRRVLAICIIVLVIIVNRDEFLPQRELYRPIVEYESDSELRNRVSKISDEYLPQDIIRPSGDVAVRRNIFESEHPITIRDVREKSDYVQAMISSSTDQSLRVVKAWFPGWHYFINNREVTASIEEGFPIIYISSGESLIELRLSDTPVRRIGNQISLIAGIICIVLYIRYEKNNA